MIRRICSTASSLYRRTVITRLSPVQDYAYVLKSAARMVEPLPAGARSTKAPRLPSHCRLFRRYCQWRHLPNKNAERSQPVPPGSADGFSKNARRDVWLPPLLEAGEPLSSVKNASRHRFRDARSAVPPALRLPSAGNLAAVVMTAIQDAVKCDWIASNLRCNLKIHSGRLAGIK